MLTKFNDENKKQERCLLITNKSIYNLKLNTSKINNMIGAIWTASILRRKIPLNKLAGITVSRIGFEFVIHVAQNYDYRYMSLEKYIHFFILSKFLN